MSTTVKAGRAVKDVVPCLCRLLAGLYLSLFSLTQSSLEPPSPIPIKLSKELGRIRRILEKKLKHHTCLAYLIPDQRKGDLHISTTAG